MKIKNAYLEEIINKATKKEIDLLIELITLQDEHTGIISNISCKYMTDRLNIARSTFYKMLHDLEKKELLEISNTYKYALWDIRLTKNIFEKNKYENYTNINCQIFDNEFLKLTKSEKIIILKLLVLHRDNKIIENISVEKLTEWTEKSIQSVRKFLKTLKNLYVNTYISKRQKKKIIRFKIAEIAKRRWKSENDIKNKFSITNILNINKIKFNYIDLENLQTLLHQYKINVDILEMAILEAKNIYEYINIKYIHLCLKKYI